MAQAVSHRPLTAQAWIRARVNPYGICGGQSGTGTGISPSGRSSETVSPIDVNKQTLELMAVFQGNVQ
jgi:hypothetical protein